MVELFDETAYGSGRNAFEASRRGTALVSPVAGSGPGNSHEVERDGPPPLTAADFQIDVTSEQATVCTAGHLFIEEYELEDAPKAGWRSTVRGDNDASALPLVDFAASDEAGLA